MLISSELKKYLTGELFSNGLLVPFGDELEICKSRLVSLKMLCKDKRVIHFGCSDHLPLIEKKLENGTYLHEILGKSAQNLVGLDYNNKAIEAMSNIHGYDHVYTFDLFTGSLPRIITNEKYDYVVMGEILEHVDNPVNFLQKMQEVFAPYCEQIIITVPNIASKHRFNCIIQNMECINTDHRYWFTPFTLAKVISRSGMDVSLIQGTDVVAANFLTKKLVNLRLRKYKLNDCDTLIGIADLN